MLHVIYTLILIYVTFILGIEYFKEKNWKMQMAIGFVLLIFILRILHIK